MKNYKEAAASLMDSRSEHEAINSVDLPERECIAYLLKFMEELLFYGLSKKKLEKKIVILAALLLPEIEKCLSFAANTGIDSVTRNVHDAPLIIEKFFDELPVIRRTLLMDMEAGFRGDPAAKTREEIILSYPGFRAITVYRLSHFFWKAQVPLIPRMMSEYIHSITGIDIHPGAEIGESFFIDHGTGVVVGETTLIGKNVKLYQGVTLGALSVKKEESNSKRHPTIEDDVTIYANATILGGKTVIGRGSVIGGSVWLTESVPPDSIIYNKAEKQVYA